MLDEPIGSEGYEGKRFELQQPDTIRTDATEPHISGIRIMISAQNWRVLSRNRNHTGKAQNVRASLGRFWAKSDNIRRPEAAYWWLRNGIWLESHRLQTRKDPRRTWQPAGSNSLRRTSSASSESVVGQKRSAIGIPNSWTSALAIMLHAVTLQRPAEIIAAHGNSSVGR